MRHNVLTVDETELTKLELVPILNKLDIKISGVKDDIEALRSLADHPGRYDAVIWSFNNADTSVFDTIKRIKSKGIAKNLPFLLVSEFTSRKFIIKAIEAGIVEYIAKPYDADTVTRKICRVLGIKNESVRGPLDEDIVTFNLNEMLNREIKSAKRGGYPLAIMLASVIEDGGAADCRADSAQIIELLSKVLKTRLRETDTIFHYGGANLLLLLPFSGKDGVASVISKLTDIFNTHSIVKNKKSGYTLITAHVCFPEDGKIKDKLLEKLELDFTRSTASEPGPT